MNGILAFALTAVINVNDQLKPEVQHKNWIEEICVSGVCHQCDRLGGRPLGIGKTTFLLREKAGWGICFLTPASSVFLATSAFTFVMIDTRSQPLEKKAIVSNKKLRKDVLSSETVTYQVIKIALLLWHHLDEVLAQRLNKPRAIFPVSVRDKRRDGGHSKQKVCFGRDGITSFKSIAANSTIFWTIRNNVGRLLLAGALACLDKKQLGFPCQRGAV